MSGLITYKIVDDSDDKLKKTAKIACNFWNRFVAPGTPIVVRLGIFTSDDNVIARSYMPWTESGTKYGRVEFNTKYLAQFSDYDIAGTIIHEIGHTLGIGFDQWDPLFDHVSGSFYKRYVETLPELKPMYVETDYDPGTQYAHWDEERFDQELMTGFKDRPEYVLPITIKVMGLLGNTVVEELPAKSDLETLMKEVEGMAFTRSEEILRLNLDHFQQTDLWEEVYKR